MHACMQTCIHTDVHAACAPAWAHATPCNYPRACYASAHAQLCPWAAGAHSYTLKTCMGHPTCLARYKHTHGVTAYLIRLHDQLLAPELTQVFHYLNMSLSSSAMQACRTIVLHMKVVDSDNCFLVLTDKISLSLSLSLSLSVSVSVSTRSDLSQPQCICICKCTCIRNMYM